MKIYLKLRDKQVFKMLRKKTSMMRRIDHLIVDLANLDQEDAVKLFVEFIEEIDVKTVTYKLEYHEEHLFKYLQALHAKHDDQFPDDSYRKMVELYIKYDVSNLLKFLEKSSEKIDLDFSLEQCELHGLIDERIFLLGQMGRGREALDLIVKELGEEAGNRAVEFCKKQNNPELWDILIDSSIDKPSHIILLLNNVGTHIEPVKLVEKIQPGLRIDNLKDSLRQILLDYSMRVELQVGNI